MSELTAVIAARRLQDEARRIRDDAGAELVRAARAALQAGHSVAKIAEAAGVPEYVVEAWLAG